MTTPPLWYPHAIQKTLGRTGQSFASGAPKRIIWHSTEGARDQDAINAFRPHPPHFLVGKDGTVYQFVALNRASYALKRHNVDGCIQIEQTMFAAKHPKPAALLASSHALSVWLMSVLRIPNDWPAGLPVTKPDPTRKTRATARVWATKGGHYGHCNVPDQQPTWHWDPGFDASEVAIVTPNCTVKGQPLVALVA